MTSPADVEVQLTTAASVAAVEPEDDKCSIVSIVCRICFDDNKDESIITPCKCKGTVAFVHRSCLEKWLSESNTTSCELCQHVYETERVPKYTAKESLWQWVHHQPHLGIRVRHIRCDIVACSILTPLAVVITYICLFSADYYSQQRFESIPTARWTSISLLIMIAIMLFGYYIWVYVVVGYHGRMWYYWWQRECIVRYIPPPPNAEDTAAAGQSTELQTSASDTLPAASSTDKIGSAHLGEV